MGKEYAKRHGQSTVSLKIRARALPLFHNEAVGQSNAASGDQFGPDLEMS